MAITSTPRLGLTQWTEGSDPFTRAQMNAAMKAIDDVVARDAQGLEKDRPAKPPVGTYYFGTDSGNLFRYDGTAWRPTASAATGVAMPLLLMGV